MNCLFTIRRRAAVTLLEVLVVVAIISLVIGLTIPSVIRARSAAERIRCASHMRQLALALHSYHGTHERFPPGTSVRIYGGQQSFMGWHTRILPFVEQENLWRTAIQAYAIDQGFHLNPPHSGLGTIVPIYRCPTDDQTSKTRIYKNVVVALTDYLGNAGTNLFTNDGVLYRDSTVRIVEIRDGASNTLLIGERPPSPDNRWGWWYAGVGQMQTGSCDMHLGVRELNRMGLRYQYCYLGPYSFQTGQDWNHCDIFHFWSHHVGGSNFAFADGSVRFLSYSSDSILPALATRFGGEIP